MRALRRARRWLHWIAAGGPLLMCGCPEDGRPVYGCRRCGRQACSAHREHEHPVGER